MRTLRVTVVAALVAAAALSAATYTIRLSPFPTAEVADGRSQVVVSAQVFDDGRPAQDGTQVVFETTLGSFRESVVRTSGGWARATLIAGGVPGVAKVKASVTTGNSTGSACEIEFVKSREELSQARETIEVNSSGSLVYANDRKVIEATAPEQGVVVRYRDIEVHADVLQLDLTSFTLKARKATVRRGRRTTKYESLFLDLTPRTGYGLTNYPVTRPETVVAMPDGIAFAETGPNGEAVVAQPRMRFGLVEVNHGSDRPITVELGEDPFALADLSNSPSTVSAKQAVVYARREIQFHRADIFVDNAKVLKFPLFVVNLNSSSGSPLVTEDLLSINDNQVALNYPHYLTLRPGFTSLLRFRTGQRYGQGLTANRGAFLDYELTWSKGDDMQGGFTFGGVGRSDWVASARQYWRLGGRTTASFQVDSPSAKSLFGSGSVTHSLGAYNFSLNGSQSQTLSGYRADSLFYGASVERNPERILGTPFRMSYGLTANESRSTSSFLDSKGKRQTQTYSQAGAGFSSRFFTDSIPLDKRSSLNASFVATKLFGPLAYKGVGLNGAVSLSRPLGTSTNLLMTYNFLQDGVNENVVGKHSVSLVGSFSSGNTNFRLSGTRALDIQRLNLSAEASYRLSGLWRVSYSHFLTDYRVRTVSDILSEYSFSEYFFILGYKIGWREVGLTWSSRTHRPGIQLMNVNF